MDSQKVACLFRTGGGARHLAVHPDGQHVFCNEEAGAKITCYDWDADTGTLTPKQSLPTLPVSGRSST